MRDINAIVIHCADTFPDMDIGLAEIDQWHRARGFKSAGYHHVIRRDGRIENGRPHAEPGAHVAGHNANTLGVCVVGGKSRTGRMATNFSREQWRALDKLIAELLIEYPGAEVKGHNDYDKGKTCPTFDVREW